MATDITPDSDVKAQVIISPDIYTQNAETKRKLQKLHQASMEGDWKTAKEILRTNNNMMVAKLNSTGMTPLHVAARCGKSRFVISLVEMVGYQYEVLTKQDHEGRTALHYAASSATVEAAAALVAEAAELTMMEDVYGCTPLFYAARWRHPSRAKEMVEYLHGLTNLDHLYMTSDSIKASNLIVAITSSGCHGIALEYLRRYPELATASNESGWSILHTIASQPPSLLLSKRSTSCSSSWMRSILCPRQKKQIDEDARDTIELIHLICDQLLVKKYSEAMEYFLKDYPLDPILQIGTRNGAYELVKIVLSYFPELIWYTSGDEENRFMLIHVAVEYRQQAIFDHIMKLIGNNIETYSDTNTGEVKAQENILHLAAKLAPAYQLHAVPGPAFQMQKELRWYKTIEDLVYKDEKMGKNIFGMTPMELFFKEHEGLIKDSKEWMKDTSNSCMVIAALVATVAFASMITVPGGTNDNTGLPVFSNRIQFVIFSVCNALSMISSAIALLVFLSIQTSRYTEKDFMESLPNSLRTGLFSLFVAVATMMIAFALAIGMALHTGINWAYIPITLVACVPAIIFTRLQLPLLIQTLAFSNTKKDLKLWCRSKILRRSRTDHEPESLSKVLVTV